MIQITKKECEYLLSKGFQWEDHLHHTVSSAHKYYATEDRKLMKELNYYRNSHIVSSL